MVCKVDNFSTKNNNSNIADVNFFCERSERTNQRYSH